MLDVAFKEWAVICAALTTGRQSIILRKGGIAEPDGTFRVEHRRFWLWPTYAHQQHVGIVPEAVPLLDQVEREKPADGKVRLAAFAEVAGIYHMHDAVGPLKLAGLHLWSMETVLARFRYREPGLFALAVRVFRLPAQLEVADRPEYAGCRSWIELGEGLPTRGAVPVLDDTAFRSLRRTLDALLNPTATA